MKSILIDPVKQQLIPFQLSFKKGLKHSYDVIDCERVTMHPLPGKLLLLTEDDAMLKATGGTPSSKVNWGYFALLNDHGSVWDLVAGRGLVMSEDDEGRASALADYITPVSLSKFIRFIPAEKNNEAAKIYEDLLEDGSIVIAPDNYERLHGKYLKSMKRLKALCRN